MYVHVCLKKNPKPKKLKTPQTILCIYIKKYMWALLFYLIAVIPRYAELH